MVTLRDAGSFLYDGYATDKLNGWLNDACVGGGKTLYPGLKDERKPCDLELVRSLVEAGASIGAGSSTAIHTAAANDHGDCVRLLVDLGGDIQAVDETGNTPLHIASVVTALTAVRALLDAGAKARTANLRGQTPRDAALAEKAMADDWCEKLDITLNSTDDVRDAENYPVVLRILVAAEHDEMAQAARCETASEKLNAKGAFCEL